MEGITTELNGIKYLQMERMVTSESDTRKLNKITKKYNGIYQGIGNVGEVGGFLSSKRYIVVKVLIPEAHVMDFQKETE